MADQTTDLTARLKLVVDNGAVKAVNSLTGELVKAADAEQELSKAAEKRKGEYAKGSSGAEVPLFEARRQRGLSDEARAARDREAAERKYQDALQRTVDALQTRARLQVDLVRLGHADGPKAPLSPAQEAAEAGRRLHRARQVDAEMVAQGFKAGPKTAQEIGAEQARREIDQKEIARFKQSELRRLGHGTAAAEKPGVLESIGEVGGMGGLSRLGRAGPYAAAAAAAAYAFDRTGQASRIENNPFDANEGVRFEKKFRSWVPFGGSLIDNMRSLRGHDKTMGDFAAWDREYGLRQDQRSRERMIQATLGNEAAGAATQAEVYRNFSYDYRPPTATTRGGFDAGTADRGTVEGRREYQEQMALLGTRHKMQEADRDQLASTRRRVDLQDKMVVLEEQERKALEEFVRSNDRARSVPDAPSSSVWTIAAGRDRDAYDAAKGRREVTQGQLDAARREESQAKIRQRETRSEFAAQNVQNLERREDLAQSQARRIGGMSGVDRVLGQQAFEYLKENRGNYDAIPDEVKARARQFAPESVGQMEEDRGKALALEAKKIAPADYSDLDAARKATDKGRAEKIEIDQKTKAEAAKLLSDAVGAQLLDIIRQAAKMIIEDRAKQDLQNFQKNNPSNNAGSSN